MHRRVLAFFAAIVGFAGAASAADMAPVFKAPPAPPVVDPWTGFYIGINGGYSWGPWRSTSIAPLFSGASFTASPKVNGWVGGIQDGYNWRINNTWLIGYEGDFQWTGERASDATSTTTTIGATTITIATNDAWKLAWFSTYRGRVGALVDPSTLLYLTGGLAVGRFQFSEVTTATVTTRGISASATAGFSEAKTRFGAAVGAGVERKFTPNWSGKLEFLYLDFGTRTFLSGTGVDTSIRLNDYVARVGINYKF